jgi:CubicO group peptidase (beta-lactamase class C family)
MRPSLPFAVAVCLVIVLPVAGQVPADLARPGRGSPTIEFAGRSVDTMIAAFMRDHDVPGLTVAIVQAPYVTRVTGFGVSNVARRTLAASNTIFDVGQMKHAFTAVAVMQLVEGGAVELDAPLVRYLPDAGGSGTVRQSLLRPADYPLLERLVASASGVTYRQFVKAGQIERLGLRSTFFAEDLPSVARESLQPGEQHRRFLSEPDLINPTEPATGYRDGQAVAPREGAIYASAGDVSLWDIALAGEILVKDPALRAILYSPAGPGVPTSGAWFFPGHPGLMVATGSGDGFSSLLSRFTRSDELVCVTLLANREGLDLTQLARAIAGAYDGRLGPPAALARLRAQQSPYSIADTLLHLQRGLGERGWRIVSAGPASLEVAVPPASVVLRIAASQHDGEVWLSATDPAAGPARGLDGATALRTRDAVDALLLQAVSFP